MDWEDPQSSPPPPQAVREFFKSSSVAVPLLDEVVTETKQTWTIGSNHLWASEIWLTIPSFKLHVHALIQ